MTNKRKVGLPLMILLLALLVLAISVGSAAASARTATWSVSVTYQNVGNAAATLIVEFFEEGSTTPIVFDPLDGGSLAAGAGRSFWIGNVSNVPSGFIGNAVLSSDQPLVATTVQFSQNPGFKMRMLYNGFSAESASDQYLVPTVLLNKFNRTTVFSIQNTESQDIEATVRFYDADNNGNLASTKVHTIKAMSSKLIEMDNTDDTGLPGATTTFSGSAIITAELVGGGAAKVVAAANEYYTNRNVATSFEGVPISKAANTVYVATGLCERFGLDTFYAVSNSGLAGDAEITIEYRSTAGAVVASDGPYTIGPGQKKSINTCKPSDSTNMSNFSGSAIITSVGNPVVAMGKGQNSINAGKPATADVFTAFLGEPAGTSKMALSFVRWANDAEYNSASNVGGRQRTYLAVQNLENSEVKINVHYNDKNGNTVETQQLIIPALAKANSDAKSAGATGAAGMKPDSFGYYLDGTFGGGVVIEADASNSTAKFIAIGRTQNPGAGEDVNGMAIGAP